ncbi:DUF4240 domain-containing protein [Aureibaculum sp. A20]|uniref:DUF4240 domain-containing protein n=1 Tax=Aureibaculum flavum TaxID=2795986 RepID=A0ABS0WUU0_9FLAO|nr:DUF4240 domain-containing protein [Aureibaculum flavum]MBJ2175732.1 DUF4240 domain-containing protein [Aureibaculum flavum]
MKVKEGDIFIAKLERDFFGAFKILQINKLKNFGEDDKLLVGVLDFVSKNKPQLPELKDCTLLYQEKFSQNYWNVKFLSSDSKYNELDKYEYLGNLPINDFEKSIPFKLGDKSEYHIGLAGSMHSNYPNQAFLEWRWRNEREAYEKEFKERKEASRIAQEAYRKRKMKPKKMIDDILFWEIISKIDWTKEGDEERMHPAIDFLAKRKVSEIKQFQENFSFKLYLLDTKEHAKNIGEESYVDKDSFFSVDYFLYVRCCVVANGKTYYEDALNNPVEMPKNLDFEALLYLAQEAYEQKMNKELNYETGCDYETFSNIKGWE